MPPRLWSCCKLQLCSPDGVTIVLKPVIYCNKLLFLRAIVPCHDLPNYGLEQPHYQACSHKARPGAVIPTKRSAWRNLPRLAAAFRRSLHSFHSVEMTALCEACLVGMTASKHTRKKSNHRQSAFNRIKQAITICPATTRK